MTCTPMKLAGGGVAIACSRGSSGKRCKWCGGRAEKLCDFPVKIKGKDGTCDANMCVRCAQNIGPNADLCPPHFRHVKSKETVSVTITTRSESIDAENPRDQDMEGVKP